MAVNLSPVGGFAAQFFNNDGVPLSGGLIYTYVAGTNTPATTFTSGAGTITHSNPIVLDSAGRVPTGEIWLSDNLAYKFVIKDAQNNLIGTYDNIVGINSNFVNYTASQEIQTATAGQTVFTLTTMAYQPGTNSLSVFVDGVNQYGPGAQYAFTETSSTSVTFASGLHVGASVKFTTAVINNIGGVDASQVTYTAPFVGAEVTNVEAKLAQTVNVLDFVDAAYHADILDGTSTYDISNAVRHAIDSLGPNGGVVNFPNGGGAVIGSTVYIPPKGYGVTLLGNKFAITGSGVDTHSIFETGMPGDSYGGSSNWSAPNETVLNQGLIIRDFVFLECGTAIKVYNAIWRSEFSGNWAYQNVTTLIHAKRCFYSKTLFNHAVIGRSGRAATDPCYWFEEAVNVQTIVGNGASGIYGGSNKSGIGFLFTGGLFGISVSNNSAEACITGMKITGEVRGAEIVGCYFELDTIGIDLQSAGKTMDIGGCFFYSNVTTAITSAAGWVGGTLRADNSIDAACLVDLSGSTNALTIERPLNVAPLTLAYSAYEIVPANWSLSGSIVVRRPASTYDAGAGQNAQRGLLTEQTNGYGLVAMPYAGDLGAASGSNPVFCSATISANTVTVDTKIVFRPNLCAQYTARIQDFTLSYKLAGAIRWGDTVFKLDATAITVTASDNGGFLRLVFGNLGASISISDIRIWIG